MLKRFLKLPGLFYSLLCLLCIKTLLGLRFYYDYCLSLLLRERNISFLFFYSQIQIDIQQNGIMIALFLSAILSIKKQIK